MTVCRGRPQGRPGGSNPKAPAWGERGNYTVDKRVVFNEAHCKGCELCVWICPKHIIRLKEELNGLGYHPAFVSDEHQTQCISCAMCARMCPDAVIEVYR